VEVIDMPLATVDASAPLHLVVEAAHQRALTALREPTLPSMDAVAWLSAHLAATNHVIYPAVVASLPEGRRQVREQRRVSRHLFALLRTVEKHHAGDGGTDPRALARSRGALLATLDEHSSAEHELLTALEAELGAHSSQVLAGKYELAFKEAPTRPHPYVPQAGPFGKAAYALDRARDHVLDTMDGRRSPVPHRLRAHVSPGRWGMYWLGASNAVESTGIEAPTDAVPRAARQPEDA
jgi:hypothetical protein